DETFSMKFEDFWRTGISEKLLFHNTLQELHHFGRDINETFAFPTSYYPCFDNIHEKGVTRLMFHYKCFSFLENSTQPELVRSKMRCDQAMLNFSISLKV